MKLRDCVRNNPSTSDGTFYGSRFSSRIYRCVDSTGTCYFRNPAPGIVIEDRSRVG